MYRALITHLHLVYNTGLEIDVCLLEEVTIESGGTRKLRTNIGICNIPDTHYVNFSGIKIPRPFSQKRVF